MNWLLALLAFAGIMAVLATIVSTLVELVHKVAASRHGGLVAMCRTLYPALSAMAGRQGFSAAGLSPEEFARLMTRRPTALGDRDATGRSGVFRGSSGARFERLTPLQFVEQLANTDVGDALAQRGPAGLRASLYNAVFQFERYGHAQSAYFRRRTKLISAAVALFVVALGNINGFAIYQHLARSPDAASAAVAFATSPEALALEEHAQLTQRHVEALAAGLEAVEENPSPQATAQLAALAEAAQGRLTVFDSALEDTRTELSAGQRLALPIGWRQFPYCAPMGQEPAGEGCAQVRPTLFEGSLDAAVAGAILFWVVCLIGTAGLLALGAPFWFDLFRTLAVVTAGTRAAQTAVENARAPSSPRRATGALRDGDRADPDALVEAFQSARGVVSGLADGPRGGRYGESSAQSVTAAQAGVRPVRL